MTLGPERSTPNDTLLTDVVFLGLSFSRGHHSLWHDILLNQRSDELRILVTPNVDHVVNFQRNSAVRDVAVNAHWRLCDSRVLNRLAKNRGLDLGVYPGSDLVRDLLAHPNACNHKWAVFGPLKSDFDILRRLYPDLDLVFVDAPKMQPGTPDWTKALEDVEQTQADMLLVCISFPKQELFAQDLKDRGQLPATAICAGASLDFLTGRQRRAPAIFRRLGIEWFWRLLTNPRRLWKRYLVDGPRIFLLYLRDRP